MPSLFSPLDPFFAIAAAVAILGAQPPPDDELQATRIRLEAERRELLATIQDRPWMQDQSRASLARLSVERGWKHCAANEAAALAKSSEKAAKLLAEAALAKCRAWERAFDLALENGAYPYVNEHASHPSREDMATLAELESRDAAIARILLWRGNSGAPADNNGEGPQRGTAPGRPAPGQPAIRPSEPPTAAPVVPTAAKTQAPPAEEEGQTITITASRGGGCRVRLADRTLTDRQLAANAKEWAAKGTPLRVIRPAGADYHCMAKIAWRLGEHGVRLFHFVDPPAAR